MSIISNAKRKSDMPQFTTSTGAGWRKSLLLSLLLSGFCVAQAQAAKSLPPQSGEVQSLMKRAADAVRAGDLRVAVLLLKNAAAAAPQDGRVGAELGTVLVMQGEMPEAERVLRDARAHGAPDTMALPPLFQAMLSRQEAQALLDQFPEPGAQDKSELASDIWRARALAHFSTGNADAAHSEIDKALALRRTAPLLLDKAQFALAAGDRDQATAYTDQALKMAPKDLNALITKIGLLEAKGDYAAASAYADRMVGAAPNSPLPRILRIEVLGQLHRDLPAKSDIDWLLQRSPNLPIALYDRAMLRLRAGDIKGAWEVAQALPPEFLHTMPQFGVQVAAIAEASGNRQIAEADLESAISYFPKYEESRVRLARMRLADKNPQSALTLLDPIKASADRRVSILMAQAYTATGQTAQAKALLSKNKGSQSSPDLVPVLALFQSGKTEQGIAQLAAMHQKEPKRADIMGPLVGFLIQNGRASDAAQAVGSFEKAGGDAAMTAFYRGQVLAAKGDFDGAQAALSTTLKLRPSFPAALYYHAQLAALRGDFSAANSDLDAMLRLDPSDTQALGKKAQLAAHAGRDAEAEALYQRAVTGAPADPGARLALADFYLSHRQYAKAEAAAAPLAAAHNAAALSLVIRSQATRGDLGAATRSARALAAAYPKSAEAQVTLAAVLETAKNTNEAAAAYAQAMRDDPGQIAAYRGAIRISLAAGKTDKAIEMARAFAKSHGGPAASKLVADTLAAAKQPDAAKKELASSLARQPDSGLVLALADLEAKSDRNAGKRRLSDWVEKHPEDTGVTSQYATMLITDGDMAGARGQLEKLVQREPYNASALNDLAWSLQKTDLTRAVALASKAARLSPGSAEILDTMGWLKWQQHDRKGALDALRQAHSLKPNEPEIGYHFAVALDGSGDRQGARQALQPILNSNVHFESQADARKLASSWR